MKVYDTFAYKQAQKRVDELETLLIQLDLIANILYNNVQYNGVWDLIEDFEEVRLKYYLEHYENESIVLNKGRVNE